MSMAMDFIVTNLFCCLPCLRSDPYYMISHR